MSFRAVGASIGMSTNNDKKYIKPIACTNRHTTGCGRTITLSRSWVQPYARNAMQAIHMPCKVWVVADCLDTLSYKLTLTAAGRQEEKYGKYTRFTNAMRATRMVIVRGSYKELKNPNSTLKADSEDFCNKGIATLCVSRLSPVALGCRCFVSFALFLTDAARRLFTALPFFPIAR